MTKERNKDYEDLLQLSYIRTAINKSKKKKKKKAK